MNPARGERIAKALVAKIPQELQKKIDIIVSPAMGGIIIGHEVGRVLGLDAIFLERPEGTLNCGAAFGWSLAKKL